MYKIPLNKESIQKKIDYIEESVNSLERFGGIKFEKFQADSDNFRIAFYDLHRALEAVMDIGSHILSRIPEQGRHRIKILQDSLKSIRSSLPNLLQGNYLRWRDTETGWFIFMEK